jgi:hypothetical protein
MIAMSLAVYLCISGLILIPFVLRYAFVVRHEKHGPRNDILGLHQTMAKHAEDMFLSKFLRHW